MDFREMVLEDIENVLTLFKKLEEESAEVSFSEITKREEIINWLHDSRMYIYVAEDNKKLVGVFRGKRGKKGREHDCFLTCAVDIESRGKKVGQNLTKYALKELKKEGIKIARAYVYSNNIPSVSTLLRSGFTSSGCVHMHHYDYRTNEYVDDLIFHKIL